ncbi:MAG: tetratricopeptide repeat protein [Vulcanimicrobiaceae bacterium]
MSVLREALHAEADGRLLESLRLCTQALRQTPDDPDALSLMGRLCALGGDVVAAIGLQRHALRIAPDHAQARAGLSSVLASIPAAKEGRIIFERAVMLAPDISSHACMPGALAEPADADRVTAFLEQAVRLDPSLARAHAALGNVLARSGRMIEALAAYRRALLLDPDAADVYLATAEIEHNFGDEAHAIGHREAALSRRTLYSEPVSRGRRLSVLVLARAALGSANVPLDFVVDREQAAFHRLYIPERESHAAPGEIPGYDIVFNAIAYSEAAASAISEAAHFISSQPMPAVNLPQHLWKTARPALARVLRDVPACAVPATVRLRRGEPAGASAFPAIVRPVDSHAGRGLERVDDRAALETYLARHAPHNAFDLAPFVEYRNGDGYYRKYRILFVDGIAYPYHLAISVNWIVHYNTSLMPSDPSLRVEEEAFLDDPHGVFPHWDETTPAIASAIGLEYFGIDCTRTDDGCMLVFEADASAWVHDKDPVDVFPYKPRAVARIRAAVAAMLDRVAGRRALGHKHVVG